MRKLTLLSGIACLATGAYAQSFTETFDSVTFTSNGVTNGTGVTAGNYAGDTVNGDVTWLAVNRSTPVGSTGWFNTSAQTGPVFTSHSGAGQLNANYNSTTSTNLIDNWLFSPVRTFNNGDVISFWSRTVPSPAYPDRLYLRLSTNGSSTASADFSTILVSINPNLTTSGYPNAWTQFSASISGLGGPVAGRFAFNYNVPGGGPTGNNSDFIGIDTIAYQAVPEPATLAVLGLGVAAAVRRRRRS